MLKSITLRTKIMAGSCLPLILVIALGIICWSGIQSLLESSNMVDHTHVVIEEAMQIEGAAVDMETGMRGYLLAGNDTFLDPYNNGKQRFASLISDLKTTVNDNPAQVARLDEIKTNIDAWVKDVVEPAIALRRQIGSAQTMDDMSDLISEKRGKVYFDRFRSQIATFIGREEKLMNERKQATGTTQSQDSGKANDAAQMVEHTYLVIQEAMKITGAAVDMETGARGYFLAGKDEFLAPYTGGKQNFEALVASLSQTVNDNPEQVKLLADIKDNISNWQKDVIEPTIALRRQIGDSQTMNDMANLVGEARGKTYFDKFRNQIKTFRDTESALMAERQEAAKTTASNATYSIVVGTSLTILIAVVISFLNTRSVVNPFKRIFAGLKTFSNIELGQLGKTFGEIIENLSSGGNQVAQASQSLAEGASEQAAGLEETSSSLEEMSSMTKQNADNAQQANTLASEAQKAANNGTEAMERMSGAINDIQKSSDETAKIIKVIDEIAFQTNLLALNAAVEAARAGEAGKGFAVVAEEVRNLAMRSAEAAKNTSAMIEESVKNSKNGVDIASEVGKVLEEIVQSIGKTNDLVSEIAAASQEQAQGIDQVNTAMAQMDKVTQQNAASAEESASASEQVMDVVGNLVQLVEANSSSQGSGFNSKEATTSRASKNHGFGKSDQAFHKIANGHTQQRAQKQTAASSVPEKAIPLKGDENTGTDDFKEFNG